MTQTTPAAAPASAVQDGREPAAGGLPERTDVAIVGAGFGGLGAAIQLKRSGVEDFVVLERAADVGGTWWANTYPGCQCDIPSNLYSFSFARKTDWTHSYPEQPQILDYLRDCARRFEVLPHIRLGCELLDAAWDPGEQRWRIETSQGSTSARVLIAAPGLLSEPSTPELPGMDRFQGTHFHSADWNHDHDLTGERVAVLGTGASAVQIVPRIQPHVEKLHVFQRTPPWVLPHPDRPVGPALQRLYRVAAPLQRLARGFVYWAHEVYVLAFAVRRGLARIPEWVSRLHMRRQVPDPDLRLRLTPDYAFGCKRLCLSNEWYPALAKPNVEVISGGIEEVRERSVVPADGVEREVDTIVFATGFTPADPPLARRLRGREGRPLSEVWQGSPQAYLGVTVAGFPNLFLLYGPNTNTGHTSIVYMMESQIHYVMEALRTMRARGIGAVEVRNEIQDAFNDDLQERLAGTVWDAGGCSSWYLDRNGRNSIMWPEFTFNYRRRLREFEVGDYHSEPLAPAASPAPLPATA
jgi:cation diffusion facilitator CzcD-associated flavoprotein CzcO